MALHHCTEFGPQTNGIGNSVRSAAVPTASRCSESSNATLNGSSPLLCFCGTLSLNAPVLAAPPSLGADSEISPNNVVGAGFWQHQFHKRNLAHDAHNLISQVKSWERTHDETDATTRNHTRQTMLTEPAIYFFETISFPQCSALWCDYPDKPRTHKESHNEDETWTAAKDLGVRSRQEP